MVLKIRNDKTKNPLSLVLNQSHWLAALVFLAITVIILVNTSYASSNNLSPLENRLLAFLDEPTKQNEEELLVLIFESISAEDQDPNELTSVYNMLTLEYIFKIIFLEYENHKKLESLVMSGNEHAIDFEFKLYGLFEGVFAYRIRLDLASAITGNPEAFLRGLDRNRKQVQDVRKLVRMSQYDYIVGQEVPETLHAERFKALESVSDPEFQEVKEKCLKELQ